MRNMMICVSVMLAVFLGWPLAFGGGNGGGQPVAASAPAAKVVPAPAAAAQLASVEAHTPAESCYKRYQREIKQCADGSAACRLKSADNWDLCEATGFWPD